MSTEFWLGALVPLYALGACLMMALWRAIPPPSFYVDLLCGVFWLGLLPFMVIAAFVNAVVRAISDQDGTFAAILKNAKWVEQQSKKKSPGGVCRQSSSLPQETNGMGKEKPSPPPPPPPPPASDPGVGIKEGRP